MQMDYPKLDAVAETDPEEYIISLYQAIGWDRESELDPKMIHLNPEHWQDICTEFNQAGSERTSGLLWMNYGPSTRENVPYGKVEVEDGAFNLLGPALAEVDKASIDETIGYLFDTEGHTVHLEADQHQSNEFLLQAAYDAREMTPAGFLEILHNAIDEAYFDEVDVAMDRVMEREGITPLQEGRYEAALDYLNESYTFESPYSHYLDQSMKVNILLGTEAEQNLDFASIGAMRDEGPGLPDAEVRDNALTWLVNQQGHTLSELQDAEANYGKWGFDAAEIINGTFLASVAEEMNNFPNTMGCVTVLAEMSMHDMAELLNEGSTLTVPANATIGIFAPWVGGGSLLDIQLERNLVIPSDMWFDLQIEGAGCGEYTVNNVYGLVEEAWKKPIDISRPMQNREKPLDDLMKEAKEKAAERNVGRPDQMRTQQPPEMGR